MGPETGGTSVHMVIIAGFIYFITGFTIVSLLKGKQFNRQVYFLSFTICLFAMLLFHFSYLALGLPSFRGVEGLMSMDGSGYHLEAVYIVNNKLKLDFDYSPIHGGRIDYYHTYILAIHYFIFGFNPLVGKLYQVLLFSISLVLWANIARHIFDEEYTLIKHFFILLVSCLPIISYTATLTKEISLFFATSLSIYGFSNYYYNDYKFKHLWISLLGIVLMFLFRRQFALVMLFSVVFAILFSSKLAFKAKLFLGVTITIFLFILSAAPIFQQIGAFNPLTEGGGIIVGRTDDTMVGSFMDDDAQGIYGSAVFFLNNPQIALPMLTYGILMLFFHPPFLYTPATMLERSLFYLVSGYYNAFFSFLVPVFFIGIFHYKKNKNADPVFILLMIYFVLASLGTIFHSDSYRRFKLSYFWPIVYLYISYGIAMFPKWKKHLGSIILVLFVFLVLYFTADIIGLIRL